MKLVRLLKSRAVALIVVRGLALVAAWGHLRALKAQRSYAHLAANAATPLLALSRIVDQELRSPSEKSLIIKQDIREAALSLALTVAYSDLEVDTLTAQPFAAVCALLARLDWYLPTNETDPKLQGLNQFNQQIKERLRRLEPAVRAEAATRNQLAGNAGRCDLAAAAN